MKYVYQGNYIQVMGRMFAFGKPVEVNDKATMQLLDTRPDFRRFEDVAEKKEVLADQCPKCGKIVKRGKVMHQKWCKG